MLGELVKDPSYGVRKKQKSLEFKLGFERATMLKLL